MVLYYDRQPFYICPVFYSIILVFSSISTLFSSTRYTLSGSLCIAAEVQGDVTQAGIRRSLMCLLLRVPFTLAISNSTNLCLLTRVAQVIKVCIAELCRMLRSRLPD